MIGFVWSERYLTQRRKQCDCSSLASSNDPPRRNRTRHRLCRPHRGALGTSLLQWFHQTSSI